MNNVIKYMMVAHIFGELEDVPAYEDYKDLDFDEMREVADDIIKSIDAGHVDFESYAYNYLKNRNHSLLKNEFYVVNKNGYVLSLNVATYYMDDEIREKLVSSSSTETNQEWFTEYEDAHEAKYGCEWELSKANPVW